MKPQPPKSVQMYKYPAVPFINIIFQHTQFKGDDLEIRSRVIEIKVSPLKSHLHDLVNCFWPLTQHHQVKQKVESLTRNLTDVANATYSSLTAGTVTLEQGRIVERAGSHEFLDHCYLVLSVKPLCLHLKALIIRLLSND